MNVVVVDDDAELCELLDRTLTADGHQVRTADSLARTRAILARATPDVVVLDLDLGDGHGLELCRELRRSRWGPAILILTASGEIASRVAGLDAGADDYLVKPFAVAELRARVRALGRRHERAGARFERGDIELDFARRRAWRCGLEVTLTTREWEIVEALAAQQGRVVTHEALLREVWGEVTETAAASLGVLLARIRRKLGRDLIRTVRGEGHAID
jgi:DNA-binding response OmpR family regulator